LRGFHVVVINPMNGKIVARKSFDTYVKGGPLDKAISAIPKSHVVVAGI